MIITRVSPFTGKTHQMDLPVTEKQMSDFASGIGYLQDIFPNLSADEREFIKTGITPDEWDAMMNANVF